MATAQNLPGYTAGRTVTPREGLKQAGKGREIVIDRATIDSSAAYDGLNTSYEQHIRGPCFVAVSSGKWAPVKRTKVNGALSASTALVVDNAQHFKVGDSIVVGHLAANVATAIAYDTNTITLTSAITCPDNAEVKVSAWSTARGVLLDDEVKLWNFDHSAVQDKTGRVLIQGFLNQDQMYGDIAAILEHFSSFDLLDKVIFDDYQDGTDTQPVPVNASGFRRVVMVNANYTVTAADNGTLFIATGAVTFTLPTKAAGLTFGFLNSADNNMAIASAGSADDIIGMNDVAADSVTYSTTSEKVGAFCIVTILPDLTKWIAISACKNTATLA